MIKYMTEKVPETLEYFNAARSLLKRRIHIYKNGLLRRFYKRRAGKLPPLLSGFVTHHLDGDERNDEESNILYVSKVIHKRIHSRRIFLWSGKKFTKQCRKCGKRLPLSGFYALEKGDAGKSYCKTCLGEICLKRYYAHKKMSARAIPKTNLVQRA